MRYPPSKTAKDNKDNAFLMGNSLSLLPLGVWGQAAPKNPKKPLK